MSVSGDIAMAVLRLIKPGRGGFADVEKSRARAARENAAFRFEIPRSRKADFSVLEDMTPPCLVIRPKKMKLADRAVMYIYGGVTNNWRTQRGMAVNYACDAGVETWYPVYPACTEVNITETMAHLARVYGRMTARFDPKKLALAGVSMGGYYALELVSWINRESPGTPMPGLIIAHSPGGTPDSEADWEAMRRYAPRDPLFAEGDLRVIEKLIPHDAPLPDWLMTPSKGDFRNAPPSWLYYGEEILAGNAEGYRRAFERCGAGERLHVEIAQNMMHGYSCMPVFPESKRAYRETLQLIDEL